MNALALSEIPPKAQKTLLASLEAADAVLKARELLSALSGGDLASEVDEEEVAVYANVGPPAGSPPASSPPSPPPPEGSADAPPLPVHLMLEGTIGAGKTTAVEALSLKSAGDPRVVVLPEPVDAWRERGLL